MNATEIEKLIPNAKDLLDPKELLILDTLLQKILIDTTEKNTDVVNGKLQLKTSTAEVVKQSLRSFYNTKQYRNSIAKYLINVKNVSDAKLDLYDKNGLKIERSQISKNQKIAITEHLDYLTENGLNAQFNNPLRKLIYQTISNGASLTDIKEKLKTYIAQGKDTSGKLSKYLNQVAVQGADAYTSIIDQKIVDKYENKVTGFIVSGSLIETSSPQCRFSIEKLDRKISKDDFKTILDKYGDGLIEGTTFNNLPTNRLHFGCRHTFTPTLK